jgi:hypothetical protein
MEPKKSQGVSSLANLSAHHGKTKSQEISLYSDFRSNFNNPILTKVNNFCKLSPTCGVIIWKCNYISDR